MYINNCIIGCITYRNVMYLTIAAQRRWVGSKLYWSKQMTLDGKLNPREQMKRTRNGK